MSKKQKRQDELIRLVKKQGLLSIKDLAKQLNVSEMTVRRDLSELDSDSLGTTDNSHDERYDLIQALQFENDKKERIGKLAASLVDKNDAIIIDTGSTSSKVIPYLDFSKNLTIISYNANILIDLIHETRVNLLFAGGQFHHHNQLFESAEGVEFLKRTRANKLFLSAAGVHQDLGLTCANAHEIPIKKAALSASSEVILMVTSNKFDSLFPNYFAELEQVDTIITDQDISNSWVNRIENLNIQLLIAKK